MRYDDIFRSNRHFMNCVLCPAIENSEFQNEAISNLTRKEQEDRNCTLITARRVENERSDNSMNNKPKAVTSRGKAVQCEIAIKEGKWDIFSFLFFIFLYVHHLYVNSIFKFVM